MFAKQPPHDTRYSLRRHLLRQAVLLLLVSVLGMGAAMVMSFYLTWQKIEVQMAEIAIGAAKTFDLSVLDIKNSLLAIRDALAAGQAPEDIFLQARARHMMYLDFVYADFDGKILIQSNVTGRSPRVTFEPRAWLNAPPPFGDVVIGPVLFENESIVVDMVVTVADELGLPAGLLWVRVDTINLWETVVDIPVGNTGYGCLIDETGQLVAYRNRRLMVPGNTLSVLIGRTPQQIEQAKLNIYRGLEGQWVFASARSLSLIPWGILVELPVSEALASFAFPTGVLLVALALVSYLLFTTLHFAQQRVAVPLQQLTDAVNRMRDGAFEHRVTSLYQDEFGSLGDAFNDLLDTLATYQEHLEELVKERTAELEKSRRAALNLMQDAHIHRQRAEEAQKASLEAQHRAEAAQRASEAAQRASEAAQRASEAAQRASEAANLAKSEFLANMSHELRTPLTAILGFAQLMRRDPTLPPAQDENLAIILRSGEHLLVLINDILEMSKIEAGRMTLNSHDFDLDQVLTNVEEMMHVRAQKKGLQLTVTCDPAVPQYVSADEGKLRQVLLNLLGNAVKFTEKGDVSLRVSEFHELENSPTHQLTNSPTHQLTNSKTQKLTNSKTQKLLFEISDTGIGISPEDQVTLFDPFVQTRRTGSTTEGTGLGLTITQRFVHLMGGDIWVESDSGKGSIFRVMIPVMPGDESTIVEQQAAPLKRVLRVAPDQPQYRILIVEDQQETRILLRQLLTSIGLTILEAMNGQEAIECYKNWHPHLIFMDMRMPVMDGYEATRRIRALGTGHTVLGTGHSEANVEHPTLDTDFPAPSIQPPVSSPKDQEPGTKSPVIIALTASAFEEDRQQVLDAGCDDFVRKPFTEDEIFSMLTTHLGVQYLYKEEPAADVTISKAASLEALTPEALAMLPSDVLQKLESAVIRSNMDQVAICIDAIRMYAPAVAEAFQTLADEFQYDDILQFIRSD